jgi:glycosyltransferase involved in cell wall biosynthesis
VVDDFSGPPLAQALERFGAVLPLRVFRRHLRKNFAAQRNFMKAQCRGRLIFFLDPDELPPPELVRGLPRILEMMERDDIDVCQLPRLNVLLDGETLPHPLAVDLQAPGVVTYWEDQTRILRNLPHLKWVLRLHEHLTGIRRGYRFPHTRDYALLHCKTRARQARQRAFYRSLHMRHVTRAADSVRKRLPWRRVTEWVAADPPV